MAYTEYGFGPDATVASGSIYSRINNGRDEVNSNNGNEGGVRFIEDGVEFWFSASDTAERNKGVAQLRTDEFNGVAGSLYAQTSNQTDQNFPGGATDETPRATPKCTSENGSVMSVLPCGRARRWRESCKRRFAYASRLPSPDPR